MLRALRRLLRPGGRIGYYTIFIAPGLSTAERRRARRSGPRAVASRADQRDLLGSAGFTGVEEVDVTADFERSARAWFIEATEHAADLRACLPPGEFGRRQGERRRQLGAIEGGLLRRALFTAHRPYRGVR